MVAAGMGELPNAWTTFAHIVHTVLPRLCPGERGTTLHSHLDQVAHLARVSRSFATTRSGRSMRIGPNRTQRFRPAWCAMAKDI
jgi:hypothetical protein